MSDAEKYHALIAEGWTVVEHKSYRTTGISGTLFKNTDTNELVLSFRSAEFIDDAARDNQATNAMATQDHGWAIGQVADMEDWLKTLNLKYGDPLTVTGYSLGGHLATAFNLLHPGLAQATYTFNGAGVGNEKNGVAPADNVAQFDAMLDPAADLSHLFTHPTVHAVYQSLRSVFVGGAVAPTEELRQSVLALLPTPGAVPGPVASSDPGVRLLYEAVNRIEKLQSELGRIGNPPYDNCGATPYLAVANAPFASNDSWW